jgi:hypothetical protein
MRPQTVSIGPSLNSSANSICLSQSPGGVTGMTQITFTASSASITGANTFVAGQKVFFHKIGGAGTNDAGTLPTGFITNLAYYVISTGLSTSAFEVSQSPGGTAVVAGSNTLTGTQYVRYTAEMAINGALASNGVATLATPQRVLITTADTTTTFTLTGTSAAGTPQTESFTVSTATYSALDYATITKIGLSAAPTAAVTVGTNGIGSTPWVRLDEWADGECSVQCNVTGTVNYTVQVSNDDPDQPWGTPVLPSAMTWLATNDTNVVNATASSQTNFFFSPTYARVLLNSGSGSVSATFRQFNVVNR